MFKRTNSEIDYEDLEERVRIRLKTEARQHNSELPAWQSVRPMHGVNNSLLGRWEMRPLRRVIQRMRSRPMLGRLIEPLVQITRPLRQWIRQRGFAWSLRAPFDRFRSWPFLGPLLEWCVALVRLHRVKHMVMELNRQLEEIRAHKAELEAQIADQGQVLREHKDWLEAQEGTFEAHANALGQLSNELGQEAQARGEALSQLSHELSQEAQAREEALSQLSNELNQESQARAEAIAARRQEIRQLREEVTLLRTQGEIPCAQSSEATQPHPFANLQPSDSQGISSAFYEALEDRFRGESSTVAARLETYLEQLRESPPVQSGSPVMDLGCGRGEWLALLEEKGFRAEGVDANPTAVARCQEQELNVTQEDVGTALRRHPAGAFGAVTAFHLAEHLPFDTLMAIMAESLRVLAPQGTLILETPNPENLKVATHNFHLDPTHRHPLPPNLLVFMAEYLGFEEVTVQRLHPIPEAFQIPEDTELARRVNEAFYGPQDYALIARKANPEPATDP